MSYCTVQDVRDLTGLSVEEADDTLVSTLISEAETLLHKLTGRKFTQETVVEKFPCRKTIRLKYPVLSVEYVKADNYTLSEDNYVLFEENGILALLIDCRYYGKVEVKYTYGYSETPGEVKQLCAYLAALLAYIRLAGGEAKATIGDLKIEYAEGSKYAEKIRELKEKINQLTALLKQTIHVG